MMISIKEIFTLHRTFQFTDLRNKDLENDVFVTMSTVKVIRSLRSNYQLTKTKTDC